ncbi:MAG: pilus assembly protein TadG-related protein [Armatimonadia bacterium]
MSFARLGLALYRVHPNRRNYPRGRRAGAVMVFSAMALLVMIGSAALCVDVGLVAIAASRVQGVADAAALAAAGDTINGRSAAMRQRIDDIVAVNNTGWPSLATCGDGDITVYGTGSTVPGFGDLENGQEGVQVAVRAPVDMMFAGVLGVQDREVIRTATALRSPAAGGDAVIYGGASGSKDTGYKMTGQNARIGGAVHSNSMISISGGYGIYSGLVEYRNKFACSGQNNSFEQGVAVGQIQPLPLNYTPEDFAPYDYEISEFHLSTQGTTVPPGVYRVHGDVGISGGNTIMDNVTFVADGAVQISGANCRYTANRLGVFAYALDTGSNAIQVSGVGSGCAGILIAPAGTAHFSGGSMTTTYGAIIAQAVEVSGANFSLLAMGKWADGSLVKLVK